MLRMGCYGKYIEIHIGMYGRGGIVTILLVDSDKSALDRETKRLTQQTLAITVSLHSSGDDALQFSISHDVDMVFTRDILADMTGRELAEKIRQVRPKVECHILSPNEEIPFNRFLRSPLRFHNIVGGQARSLEKTVDTERTSTVETRRADTPGHFFQAEQEEGDRSMTEQELRSLNRKELLEIMIEQGRELETSKMQYEKDLAFLKSEHEKDMDYLKTEYEKEIATLKEELEHAQSALKSRQIDIDEAGSIAMAALQLNGVFEAAQAASQQYIENIRSLSDRQASICAQRDAESKAEQERRMQETTTKCAQMEYLSKKKCEEMEAEAKRKSEAYWAEVSHRLQSFYENHQELKKLLNFSSSNFSL